MTNIYFSYTSADTPYDYIYGQLAEQLEGLGVSITTGPLCTHLVSDEHLQRIQEAAFVVLIWSRNSIPHAYPVLALSDTLMAKKRVLILDSSAALPPAVGVYDAHIIEFNSSDPESLDRVAIELFSLSLRYGNSIVAANAPARIAPALNFTRASPTPMSDMLPTICDDGKAWDLQYWASKIDGSKAKPAIIKTRGTGGNVVEFPKPKSIPVQIRPSSSPPLSATVATPILKRHHGQGPAAYSHDTPKTFFAASVIVVIAFVGMLSTTFDRPSAASPFESNRNLLAKSSSAYSSAQDSRAFLAPIPVATKPLKEDVIFAQNFLKTRGFYLGDVDGQIGEKTVQAILSFQKLVDLREDGTLSDALLAEMKQNNSFVEFLIAPRSEVQKSIEAVPKTNDSTDVPVLINPADVMRDESITVTDEKPIELEDNWLLKSTAPASIPQFTHPTTVRKALKKRGVNTREVGILISGDRNQRPTYYSDGLKTGGINSDTGFKIPTNLKDSLVQYTNFNSTDYIPEETGTADSQRDLMHYVGTAISANLSYVRSADVVDSALLTNSYAVQNVMPLSATLPDRAGSTRLRAENFYELNPTLLRRDNSRR